MENTNLKRLVEVVLYFNAPIFSDSDRLVSGPAPSYVTFQLAIEAQPVLASGKSERAIRRRVTVADCFMSG
jgi:hypothetical protein